MKLELLNIDVVFLYPTSFEIRSASNLSIIKFRSDVGVIDTQESTSFIKFSASESFEMFGVQLDMIFVIPSGLILVQHEDDSYSEFSNLLGSQIDSLTAISLKIQEN